MFAIGSLVRARGREWVVLPESDDKLLVLRPLGGADDEVTGIYMPLEKVEPASFDLPDPQDLGDYRSCRFLRDAVRLSFRHSAGPFRSLGRIAVEPRMDKRFKPGRASTSGESFEFLVFERSTMSYKNALCLPGAGGFPPVWPYFSGRTHQSEEEVSSALGNWLKNHDVDVFALLKHH